jgi:acyl-CoA thioesterase
MDTCTHPDNVLDELLTLLKLEKIEENIFTRDGRLIASISQKGLIRYHGK